MRKITFKPLLSIFISLFALLFTQPASAHGGDPRIEIEVDRINPGSVLVIRGVDFEYDEEVTLSLIGSQVEIAIGKAIADTEGIFLLNIAIPADLAEGTYVVRAITDDHELDSPEFVVWGVTAQNQEDNVIRDQSDVQLGSLPTLAPQVPTPILSSDFSPQSRPPDNPSMSYAWIVAGIGIILFLGLMVAAKRKG